MNEQDIIKRIEEETKDLPIPESISPSNMEKMLNEKMREQDAQREGGAENVHHFKTPMPFKKRLGLAMAACFGVIIIGSGAMTLIKNNTDNYSAPGDSAMTKEAESVYEESAGESYDEEIHNRKCLVINNRCYSLNNPLGRNVIQTSIVAALAGLIAEDAAGAAVEIHLDGVLL